MCFLRTSIVGMYLKCAMTSFQEFIPSGQKAIHISVRFASYSMKSISIASTVQGSPVTRKFIVKITLCIIHNESVKLIYTNVDQIRIPSPIHHRA